MIRMTVFQRPDGMDVARYAGTEAASRNGCTMALARKMVATGVPDGPWEAYCSDGRLRFYGPSLHNLARWTISETDRGMRRLRFVENPRFPVHGNSLGGFSEPNAGDAA